MESHFSVTKGASPSPLLSSISLSLSQACWTHLIVSRAGLSAILHVGLQERVGDMCLGLCSPRNGTQVAICDLNLQPQKITVAMSMLRLKMLFLTISG